MKFDTLMYFSHDFCNMHSIKITRHHKSCPLPTVLKIYFSIYLKYRITFSLQNIFRIQKKLPTPQFFAANSLDS